MANENLDGKSPRDRINELDSGKPTLFSSETGDQLELWNSGSWIFTPSNISEEPDAIRSINYISASDTKQLILVNSLGNKESVPLVKRFEDKGPLENQEILGLQIHNNFARGGTADIYSATTNGLEVVLKTPREDSAVSRTKEANAELIRTELDFLKTHQQYVGMCTMEDLGVSVGDWKIKNEYVKLIEDPNATEWKKMGWVVMDRVVPFRLQKFIDDDGGLYDQKFTINEQLPASLYIACLMSWVKTLVDLEKEGLALDSNALSDNILENIDPESMTISFRRVDATPLSDDTGNYQVMKQIISEFKLFWSQIPRLPYVDDSSLNNISFDKILQDVELGHSEIYADYMKQVKVKDDLSRVEDNLTPQERIRRSFKNLKQLLIKGEKDVPEPPSPSEVAEPTTSIKSINQLFERLKELMNSVDWKEPALLSEDKRILDLAGDRYRVIVSEKPLNSVEFSSVDESALAVIDLVEPTQLGKILELFGSNILHKNWTKAD